MTKRFFILLLILPNSIFGQVNECLQFENVIEYLKFDSTFTARFNKVKLKFKIGHKVRSGGVYPFMVNEYIVGKLELEDEAEIDNQDSVLIESMYDEVVNDEFRDTMSYISTCITKLVVKRNTKIFVNFCRKDEDVLCVYTSRIYRKSKYPYGMIHLFFFDEDNKIKRVFDSTWVE